MDSRVAGSRVREGGHSICGGGDGMNAGCMICPVTGTEVSAGAGASAAAGAGVGGGATAGLDTNTAFLRGACCTTGGAVAGGGAISGACDGLCTRPGAVSGGGDADGIVAVGATSARTLQKMFVSSLCFRNSIQFLLYSPRSYC
ncbi:hypothetical protein DENSPDRAFT_299138 [Dentipellis sp. KUC8613]|nr:hypothetical protein DENSPDRAFT_299138 [Dentipellis sp. KUC8613]